ncbi:MAG: sigma-70 family RNA polymerase sigma factor [Opitutaceae bacterium]
MSVLPRPSTDASVADAEAADCTEAEVIRATLAGDSHAFSNLIRLHHRRVYNFLYQMTRQHQDAEDLAQQTFIKAYHNLARFEPHRPLINWILTIARNTALNHFRAAKKWDEIPHDTAASEPSPARTAETRDQSENLWGRARTILSRREFEILWLRFAEELSTEETARVVGLTETHVKVIVFRARQAMLKGASQL